MPSVESLHRYENAGDLSFQFVSARVRIDYPNVEVTLVDGRVDVIEHKDWVFSFSHALACSMHEEFAHPTMPSTHGVDPTIGNGNASTYPVLVVGNSPMFEKARFEYGIRNVEPMHFRFCTAFPVVDVFAASPPQVSVSRRGAEIQ